MIKHFAPYDQVSDEYYDSLLHPTCANFRQLGHKFLEDLRSNAIFERKFRLGRILETGAGFSMSAEVLARDLGSLENLTVQDASEGMLKHSMRWQNSFADIYVSDARQLQAKDKSYDIALSFLCDPYNDQGLWREVNRVLSDSGLWVMTTPSHHWAKRFRSADDTKSSRFVTRDQREVDLPSFTYPVSQIVSGVEKYGLYLRKYIGYTIDHIEGNVSKKLYANGSGGGVLDCFLFQKSPD